VPRSADRGGPPATRPARSFATSNTRGFRYSPRYLGIDGLGRDVLSLLPGTPMATLRGDD
jgi:hypothetical protein